MSESTITVIIPTLNEAACIDRSILSCRKADGFEILVVDGGSTDGTLERVKRHPVQLLISKPGRAHQMNRGAEQASGDILLFLHGDTELPPNARSEILAVLSRSGVSAGAFRLKIGGNSFSLRIIERVANWRSTFLQFPYGDQGLFLRRQIFLALGGFEELPFMEDFEMIRRLRKKGTVGIAATAVTTSARRWGKLGPWRTTLMNQALILGYLCGVSPARLRTIYERPRNRQV